VTGTAKLTHATLQGAATRQIYRHNSVPLSMYS